MSEVKAVNPSVLRKFSPLDGMKKDNLIALARKIAYKQTPCQRFASCSSRETPERQTCIWLRLVACASMNAQQDDRIIAMIRAGSEEARNPLAPHLPRTVSARAVDAVECLVVESELLDMMITLGSGPVPTKSRS